MPEHIQIIDHTRNDDATVAAALHGSFAQTSWGQFAAWEAPYRTEPDPERAQDVAWAGEAPCAYVRVALDLFRGARGPIVTWREFFAAAAVLHHPASPPASRSRARSILYAFAEAHRSWAFAREAVHRMADDMDSTAQRPLTSVQVMHMFELTLDAHLHAQACSLAAVGTGSSDWDRILGLASSVHSQGRRFLAGLPSKARNAPPTPITADDGAKGRELAARCRAVTLSDLDVFAIGHYASEFLRAG